VDVADDDEVVGLAVTEPERPFVLAVCEHGFGKRTNIEEFRIQNRGGKGIILIDASERNGPVVDVKLVNDKDELMLITDRGQMLRTRVGEIRETGRNAQGVKIMSVEDGERVVGVERLAESGDDADGEPELPQGSTPPTSLPPPDGELN
jgi:DNA gyrase subunit A